ncbi:MAG: glutamate 5-kinase [Solirubrobacteraceae bacterium]
MTVVVKLGSSVVADETGAPREENLSRICADVAALHAEGRHPVIVSSGAIAHGMKLRGLPARPRSVDELQAASAVGQGRPYQVYDRLFGSYGVASAQVLLTFFDMSARTHYLNARQTLRKLLEWDVVPVINENDTTTTDEISFGDNDFLAAQVAILLGAELLVLLTSTDGLHAADPRDDPNAALVREVTDFSALDELRIGHRTTPLGSGGMRSKVVAAEMATAAGVATVVGSGFNEGVLAAAAAGDAVGTRFPARGERYSSFKLWLKYAKPERGRLTVDDGAARALRDGGRSLLPVGIVDVEGSFEAGDAVGVVHERAAVGKGICTYSADELRRVMGMKTADVRGVLPRSSPEAVHRDYFVLE